MEEGIWIEVKVFFLKRDLLVNPDVSGRDFLVVTSATELKVDQV